MSDNGPEPEAERTHTGRDTGTVPGGLRSTPLPAFNADGTPSELPPLPTVPAVWEVTDGQE